MIERIAMLTPRRECRNWLLILMTGVLSSVSMASEAPNCETLTATGNPEYPPYLWRTSADGDELVGAIPQVLDEIGRRLGIEIKVSYTGPWSRAQRQVRTGHVDLMAGAFFTVERAQWMSYIRPPVMTTRSVVWIRENSGLQYSDRNDLRSLKGVTVIHNSFGQAFDEFARHNLEIDKVSSVRQAFRMLQRQRVDYMLYEENPGIVYSRQLSMTDDVRSLQSEISSEDLYLAVSHDSPCNTGKLRDALARVVRELVDEGYVEQALNSALQTTAGLKRVPVAD